MDELIKNILDKAREKDREQLKTKRQIECTVNKLTDLSIHELELMLSELRTHFPYDHTEDKEILYKAINITLDSVTRDYANRNKLFKG